MEIKYQGHHVTDGSEKFNSRGQALPDTSVQEIKDALGVGSFWRGMKITESDKPIDARCLIDDEAQAALDEKNEQALHEAQLRLANALEALGRHSAYGRGLDIETRSAEFDRLNNAVWQAQDAVDFAIHRAAGDNPMPASQYGLMDSAAKRKYYEEASERMNQHQIMDEAMRKSREGRPFAKAIEEHMQDDSPIPVRMTHDEIREEMSKSVPLMSFFDDYGHRVKSVRLTKAGTGKSSTYRPSTPLTHMQLELEAKGVKFDERGRQVVVEVRRDQFQPFVAAGYQIEEWGEYGRTRIIRLATGEDS